MALCVGRRESTAGGGVGYCCGAVMSLINDSLLMDHHGRGEVSDWFCK